MRILALRGYRDAKHVIENGEKDDPRREAIAESRVAHLWSAIRHVKEGDWSIPEAEQHLKETS